MILGITGTPGTGKTSVGEQLSKQMDWKLIKINEIVKEKELYDGYDEKRDSYIVDEEKLDKILDSCVKKNCILEGHLAHYYSDLDLLIVLRTNPNELRRRLKGKGWKEKKVVENLQAEILDIILQQAVERQGEVYEVNTSDKSAYKSAKIIKEIIEDESEREEYEPGRIDWSGYLSY